jgi:hypothetical protein
MPSGFKRRQECGPTQKTFKAEFELPRGKRRAKLSLVPVLLETPKRKRRRDGDGNSSRGGTGSKRRSRGKGSGISDKSHQDQLHHEGEVDFDDDVHVLLDFQSTSTSFTVSSCLKATITSVTLIYESTLDAKCLYARLEDQQGVPVPERGHRERRTPDLSIVCKMPAPM